MKNLYEPGANGHLCQERLLRSRNPATMKTWRHTCPLCHIFSVWLNTNFCFFLIPESRGEFLEKLQRARGQVKLGTPSQPFLSSPGSTRLSVGNWSLTCTKDKEVSIHNADGQQATILREDLAGFVFESNRGTKHTFNAETSLGPEFAAGWMGKRGKRFVSKVEAQKLKIRNLAAEIQEKYLLTAQATPRKVVATLQEIVTQLHSACLSQENLTKVGTLPTGNHNRINVQLEWLHAPEKCIMVGFVTFPFEY